MKIQHREPAWATTNTWDTPDWTVDELVAASKHDDRRCPRVDVTGLELVVTESQQPADAERHDVKARERIDRRGRDDQASRRRRRRPTPQPDRGDNQDDDGSRG